MLMTIITTMRQTDSQLYTQSKKMSHTDVVISWFSDTAPTQSIMTHFDEFHFTPNFVDNCLFDLLALQYPSEQTDVDNFTPPKKNR
jgi:hypothetical protein